MKPDEIHIVAISKEKNEIHHFTLDDIDLFGTCGDGYAGVNTREGHIPTFELDEYDFEVEK